VTHIDTVSILARQPLPKRPEPRGRRIDQGNISLGRPVTGELGMTSLHRRDALDVASSCQLEDYLLGGVTDNPSKTRRCDPAHESWRIAVGAAHDGACAAARLPEGDDDPRRRCSFVWQGWRRGPRVASAWLSRSAFRGCSVASAAWTSGLILSDEATVAARLGRPRGQNQKSYRCNCLYLGLTVLDRLDAYVAEHGGNGLPALIAFRTLDRE